MGFVEVVFDGGAFRAATDGDHFTLLVNWSMRGQFGPVAIDIFADIQRLSHAEDGSELDIEHAWLGIYDGADVGDRECGCHGCLCTIG